MQIRGGQVIAGLNAKVLRDFLRKCHTGFSQDRIIKDLKVSTRQAARIISTLLREGYIEAAHTGSQTICARRWYCATTKGKELMRASAASRVSRKTAQMTLDAFMRRVNEVNRDPRYLCFITQVVVFGSFLKNVDKLGDVDVAVDIHYRIPRDENLWKAVRKYAEDSGCSFPTFEAEQSWPIREIKLLLKARKRTIRIESWYSFTEMEKTPDFKYEVLLGDKSAIRNELEKAERERQKGSAKKSIG